jgi:hypothetical protein
MDTNVSHAIQQKKNDSDNNEGRVRSNLDKNKHRHKVDQFLLIALTSAMRARCLATADSVYLSS